MEPPVTPEKPIEQPTQIPPQPASSWSFKPLFVVITTILLAVTGYAVYQAPKPWDVSNPDSQSSLEKTYPVTQTQPESSGTIEITNLTPPDFTNQELNNLKLNKNNIDTSSVPQLSKKSGFLFVKPLFAEASLTKAVYKAKHNDLSATQAKAMAQDWGFVDKPIKEDIRNDYEYFLEWGTFSSEAGTAVLKKYWASGEFEKFNIHLVWDKEEKYGVGAYHRSNFGWHTASASANAAPISKEEAGLIALDFLKSKNILPLGTLTTHALNKEEHSMVSQVTAGTDSMVYVHRNIMDTPVIDGGVSYRPEESRLRLGLKGNTVISIDYEEFMTQIDLESFDMLPVITEQEAFEDLLNSKTIAGKVKFNNFNPAWAFEMEVDWSKNTLKNLSIKNISTAYYRNENQTHLPSAEYYQPIYVFKTTGLVSGADFPNGGEETEITFYVPAVRYDKVPTSPVTPSASQSAPVSSPSANTE